LTAEARLAQVCAELESEGIDPIILGGHAVRFYGVDRNTIDFDLVVGLSDADWNTLGSKIASRFPGAREGSSWRPNDFRRFIIGALPDGREERLEFWRHNHLLADFDFLRGRSEQGLYGGRTLRFIGLDDLIRSKETEREDDWRDVALLEEIADERRVGDPAAMLVALRSRRGFDRIRPSLTRPDVVETIATRCFHPIAAAFVAPFTRGEIATAPKIATIIALLEGPLRVVGPASSKHLALVEAVRRLYRANAMAADRTDKERVARS
jgi:hypothetical protein